MQRARKTLKIFHSIAACGIIGGLGCYMVLLAISVPETLQGYADLRQSISVISNYVIFPSLALVIGTGLLAMVVHAPFMDKGWAWLKTISGLLMFEGTLTIIGARANYAAQKSAEIAAGAIPADSLDDLISREWGTLAIVMGIAIANVILGVWRPKRIMPQASWEKDAAADQQADAAPVQAE